MSEVLIAGAGPAGLTLAIELARRGVAFRLIDIAAAPFAGSRGKGLQPRTLEILDHLGVSAQIAAAGALYPFLRLHIGPLSFRRGSLGTHHAPTVARPYPNLWMVPQSRTEAILRNRLAELGGGVEQGVGLAGFAQDDTGVTASLTNGETARSSYLIGCDGGRSVVRAGLGLELKGQTLDSHSSIVADLEIARLSRRDWHLWIRRGMRLHLCPLPHTQLFQLQAPAAMLGGAGPDGLTADTIAAGIERVTGHRVGRVVWHSVYGHNARAVDRLRVGRVLLAGDAAHIHPPAGGQGLNTSLQDAWNLGWKLAWVLRGGPQALLDSYESERLPAAARVLALTGQLHRSGSHKRGALTNQLDQNYRDSAVSQGAPAHGLAPGDHLPDARLRDGTRLYDALRAPHAHQLEYRDGTRILVRPDSYIARISRDDTAEYAGAPVGRIIMD